MFKLLGNVDPKIAATVASRRILDCLARHGDGSPGDHMDPSNGQLTPKSEACIQFEGLFQPLDNILNGLPIWSVLEETTMKDSSVETRECAQVRFSIISSSVILLFTTY